MQTFNLNNKSFCFTGAASIPRAKLWQLTEDNGGIVHKSCTKDTDFLVVADMSQLSLKTQKAIRNGTKLISEQDFMNFCDFGISEEAD
jgi:DNA ligase (NAD+)